MKVLILTWLITLKTNAKDYFSAFKNTNIYSVAYKS